MGIRITIETGDERFEIHCSEIDMRVSKPEFGRLCRPDSEGVGEEFSITGRMHAINPVPVLQPCFTDMVPVLQKPSCPVLPGIEVNS